MRERRDPGAETMGPGPGTGLSRTRRARHDIWGDVKASGLQNLETWSTLGRSLNVTSSETGPLPVHLQCQPLPSRCHSHHPPHCCAAPRAGPVSTHCGCRTRRNCPHGSQACEPLCHRRPLSLPPQPLPRPARLLPRPPAVPCTAPTLLHAVLLPACPPPQRQLHGSGSRVVSF